MATAEAHRNYSISILLNKQIFTAIFAKSEIKSILAAISVWVMSPILILFDHPYDASWSSRWWWFISFKLFCWTRNRNLLLACSDAINFNCRAPASSAKIKRFNWIIKRHLHERRRLGYAIIVSPPVARWWIYESKLKTREKVSSNEISKSIFTAPHLCDTLARPTKSSWSASNWSCSLINQFNGACRTTPASRTDVRASCGMTQKTWAHRKLF